MRSILELSAEILNNDALPGYTRCPNCGLTGEVGEGRDTHVTEWSIKNRNVAFSGSKV